MTSIDVGKLQSVEADPLYAAAKSIRIQPAWIDKAWDGVDTVPEPQYMDAGERGALERLPPDAFKRGYTLDRLSLGLGVESQFSMPEEAQAVLRQYREAKSAGWADDIRVRQLTYERGRMTPEGTPDLVNEVVTGTARAFESVGNGLLTLGELALIEAPRVAFDIMSGVNAFGQTGWMGEKKAGTRMVEAGNSVLGIEGSARPEPGVYLETLARKVAGSEQPIAELYKDVQKAEGARKAGRGAVAGTAEFAGEMLGGAGPLFIGKLAGALGAAEKTLVSKLATTPLVKKVVEAGVKAAPRLFPKAVGAARLAASPGLRIGASAGLETEGSGSERLGAFLFGAATAPIAVAISHGASRLASGALRGSPRFNAAFADWLEAKGGGLASRAPAGALGEFIEAGMPGVPGSVVFRAAAESAKAFAEGLGFSAMDLGWWHDVYKSMANGDAAATARMVEKVYGNALGLAILSRGGNGRWYEQFEAEAAAAALKASRMAREARWAKRPEWKMPPSNEPAEPPKLLGETPAAESKPSPGPSPRKPSPTGKGRQAGEQRTQGDPEVYAREQRIREAFKNAASAPDVAMAKARVKLHGIGEPITDVERMHYDGEKPPIIVRWTPEFGYQKRNALDPQETWVRMRSKDVEVLRLAAPPSGPIPEQLAVADLVAKELAERTDIAPETAVLGAETLQVLSTVPKAEDMAVQAAVEVAQMIPPAQWKPEQFDAFNQLILRGTTPSGQMVTGKAFVEGAQAVAPTEPVAAQSGPAEDPRPAVDIRALEEAQGAAIRDLRLLGPEPRKPSSEKKFFGAKGRAGAAPEHVALFDAETKAYSSWRRRYSKLKKIEVEASNKLWFARQKAESQSQPDVLPTDLPDAVKIVTDEIVGPEAGAVDPRVTAAAILTAATYATAGPIGLGISGMALLERTLYQHWAQPIAERLQYQGDAELSKPVRQMFAKIRQETAEFSARLEPLVQRVREMASESPFNKVSREHQEAARFAQHVNWTDLDVGSKKSKRGYGVDNHLLYQDAWIKDWTGLDPKVKELFEAVHAVIVESGKMGHEVGIESLDKKTGRTFVPKYNPERYILTRIITSDFYDILQKPGSELWNVVRDGIMDLDGVTLEEADMSMKLLQQTVGFRRSSMESTRILRRMMSYIRSEDGREVQLLETRPFEYVSRLQNAVSQRLANIKVKGQEALTDEHHKDSPVGVPLSPRATPEQIAARKDMEAYVSGSKDKDKALRALMAAERAHAGLPTETPGTFMADMVPAPGSDWHSFMRHVMWPMRAAWMTVKLPFTFVQAFFEPYGNPSTYLGSWRVAKADALTKWQAVTDWPALMRDARRFSEMGGVVDMPTVRWGGFNSMRLSKAHRGQDLARMFMRFGNAPNKWANWLNDITIARAGEAMTADLRAEVQKPVAQQSAARLNEVRLTLQELDYTPAEVDEFMAGRIPPEMERDFLRRLRQDTMGVRGPEKQGFLQSLRGLRFLVPFQSYTANNKRIWGRTFDSFQRALTDESMPKAERRERVKRMFAHLKNKHIALAMTMLALLLVQNGTNLMSAFEGSTPWQTVKNFYKRLLSFAAFAEIAGPVVGPLAHDLISNRTEEYGKAPVKEIVGSVAEATWIGGLLTDLVRVLNGVGDGMTFILNQAPPFRYAKQWTDDMDLLNFIKRRYEMFPPDFKGGGNLTAFQGQMKKFQTLLREEYADFSIPTHDELRSLLRDAVMTPPEDAIALAEWEKMPTSAKREAGWQHVVDSLRSRKVLRGLTEEHLRQLRTEIGERGMRRLRDLDRETARWADWAETQK